MVVKITSKGQITIPSKIRRKLGTDLVEIEMIGEEVVIRPIRKPGGALREYGIRSKDINKIMEMESEIAKNAFIRGSDSS